MKLLTGIFIFIVLATCAGATTYFVNVSNAVPTAPYTNWQMAATDIQSAIDASSDGDSILVTNGLYAAGGQVVYGALTNRVAINKAVTVQSVNGPSVTVIQGYQIPTGQTNYDDDVRCVYMTNNAVLDGFTISGGSTRSTAGGAGTASYYTQLSGGGVYCESTNCILTNCFLTGNACVSTLDSQGGGGIYGGTLNNCTLTNNTVPNYSNRGGAACYSVLNHCLVISNSASMGGGAAYSTLNYSDVIGNITPSFESTVYGGGTYFCVANNCLIAGNYSAGLGGGDCHGILTDCILSNNAVGGTGQPGGNGGGCYQFLNGNFAGSLNNCLVISNFASGYGGMGGGVYAVGQVCNCTIVGNTAIVGGGVYGGRITNCIIYYNTCNPFYSNENNAGGSGSLLIDSCITPKLLNFNTGDITNEPGFVNPALGDFHLSPNSACINAGNNASVSGANDLDGNPRIVGGTVDMGAYEYQTPASIISYAWLEQYGLPTDGSADNADTDGTGMNNWQKWIAGLNPTNSASILAMTSPAVSTNYTGVEVTWQSVTTRTYYLQRATNLVPPAFSSIRSNLVGQAGTTSYTDSTATNGGPNFYRVGIQ